MSVCFLRLFHQTLGEFALTHEEAEERTKLVDRKPVSEAEHTFKLFDLWVARALFSPVPL